MAENERQELHPPIKAEGRETEERGRNPKVANLEARRKRLVKKGPVERPLETGKEKGRKFLKMGGGFVAGWGQEENQDKDERGNAG